MPHLILARHRMRPVANGPAVRGLHGDVSMTELLLRFLLGGVAVSLFAAIAEVFKPKTFSGIFAAAPAVALVSLALLFGQRGGAVVREHALGMAWGGVSFLAYACACVFTTARTRLPVWIGAVVSWAVWFAVAAVGWVWVRPS